MGFRIKIQFLSEFLIIQILFFAHSYTFYLNIYECVLFLQNRISNLTSLQNLKREAFDHFDCESLSDRKTVLVSELTEFWFRKDFNKCIEIMQASIFISRALL